MSQFLCSFGIACTSVIGVIIAFQTSLLFGIFVIGLASLITGLYARTEAC